MCGILPEPVQKHVRGEPRGWQELGSCARLHLAGSACHFVGLLWPSCHLISCLEGGVMVLRTAEPITLPMPRSRLPRLEWTPFDHMGSISARARQDQLLSPGTGRILLAGSSILARSGGFDTRCLSVWPARCLTSGGL